MNRKSNRLELFLLLEAAGVGRERMQNHHSKPEVTFCGPQTDSRLLKFKYSSAWAARFFHDRLSETGSGIQPAPFKPEPMNWSKDDVTLSWLGHSTVLINFYGVTILTDPVLFPRIGANLKVGTIGPKRLVAPALKIRELPHVDLILLSHAHLDHTDIPTLRRFKSPTRVISAVGTADLLRFTRLPWASELGWGDQARIITPGGEVEVEAFEVNHWGTRWRSDTHRGYNGYIIRRGGKKILFGGDTAMSPSFARIKNRGKFLVGCLPIGAYNPWIRTHCTPEQAVEMANDAGVEYFVPIHHKTFRLGRESLTEPVERLQKSLEKEKDRIALQEIGQTFRCN